ncbi:MAG: bacterial Ig-like domain-containing protein [Syntrophothermaceae bacterium]
MLVGKNGPGKIALCLMLSLFLGFGSLIVPGTANAVTGENEVTLALSSSTAEIGDEITASGIADPDTWVSIKVVDETGNIVFYDAVKSEDSGAYSCTFRVPISSGILTVVAGYGTNVATGDLTVTTDVTTDVTLELSSYGAKVGDVITTSGTAGPDTWISIKVVDETGNIVFYDAVKSKAGGDYSCEFRVPQVSPGTLTVVAGYGTNVASKPLVISEGGDVTLESIMITKPATKLVYIKGDSLDISGLEVTGHYSNGTSRVETITTANVSDFDSSKPGRQLLTITINGKTATYEVTITKPIEAKKDQTITIEDDPVTITVPVEASGAKIDVADKKESLPLIAVRAATDVGTVEMAIPEAAKISKAPEGWDGTIALPAIKAQPGATIPKAKNVIVIEVGLPDQEITFDQAVRLVIPNQAGKDAGWIRGGEFTPITRTIGKDDQEIANRDVPDEGDAKIDVGDDLVIWTKHFTEFVAYEQEEETKPSPGGGGGGGGGPAFFGGTEITADQGGKLSGHGATVEIPAKAFEQRLQS